MVTDIESTECFRGVDIDESFEIVWKALDILKERAAVTTDDWDEICGAMAHIREALPESMAEQWPQQAGTNQAN